MGGCFKTGLENILFMTEPSFVKSLVTRTTLLLLCLGHTLETGYYNKYGE